MDEVKTEGPQADGARTVSTSANEQISMEHIPIEHVPLEYVPLEYVQLFIYLFS